MHGRPRIAREKSQEELDSTKKMMDVYQRGKKAVLIGTKEKIYNSSTYDVTSAMLVINPDFYTVFNYRKEILLSMFTHSNDEQKSDLLSKEMDLMTEALKAQPKSYYAWFHRLWVIDNGYLDLEKELALCTKFLELDSRNFHCWNHRRSIATLAIQRHLTTIRAEYDFTTEKIRESTSNYSAWHYRSVLLPLLAAELAQQDQTTKSEDMDDNIGNDEVNNEYPDDGKTDSGDFVVAPKVLCSGVRAVDKLLCDDLYLCATAFSVAVNDQSAWLYHRWLMGLILSFHSSDPEVQDQVTGKHGQDVKKQDKSRNNAAVTSLLPYIPKFHSQMTAYTSHLGSTRVGQGQEQEQEQSTASLSVIDIFSQLSTTFTNAFLIKSRSDEENMKILQNKIDTLLIQMEFFDIRLRSMTTDDKGANKWVLTAISILEVALTSLLSLNTISEEVRQKCQITRETTIDHLETLVKIDPLRQNYYKYVLAQLQPPTAN